MMEKIKYKFGVFGFATLKEAQRFFQHLKDEVYEPGELWSIEHSYALYELIKQRHPNAEEKIGEGVAYAGTTIGPTYENAFFYFQQTSGSTIDASYRKAISPPSPLTVLSAALRNEIREQIKEFRTQFFKLNPVAICPITGKKVTLENCHVHHELPNDFSTLVKDWLERTSNQPKDIELFEEAQGIKKIKDRIASRSWRSYHKKNAVLQVVSIEGHKPKAFADKS